MSNRSTVQKLSWLVRNGTKKGNDFQGIFGRESPLILNAAISFLEVLCFILLEHPEECDGMFHSAWSRMSARFVAAMTTTPLLLSKPELCGSDHQTARSSAKRPTPPKGIPPGFLEVVVFGSAASSF